MKSKYQRQHVLKTIVAGSLHVFQSNCEMSKVNGSLPLLKNTHSMLMWHTHINSEGFSLYSIKFSELVILT